MTETKWIPVSERLPEVIDGESDDVLVTYWSGTTWLVKIAVYWGFGEWSINNRVTAWMPLPEPYKEAK